MTIKQVYIVAINDGQNRSPRTGYSQDQSNQIDQWITRLAALAAFLGWNSEIVVDNCSNKYEAIIKMLKDTTPDSHEFSKHSHTYEIAGIIVEDSHVPFNQI